MTIKTDVVIAGGGFGGLICAKVLAENGISVTLLERKKVAGQGMHTTGIIVGECAEEFSLPDEVIRKITDVKLFAPNLKHIDLTTDDYFFLTTDTPALMKYLSDEAEKAGATILYDTPYENAAHKNDEIEVNNGSFFCKFLIGADGPRSKVAEDFSLGKNTKFLLGAEAEYKGLDLPENSFYCFLDQQSAYGYLGWVIPSVGITQVGLACRMPKQPDIKQFTKRMKNIIDFDGTEIVARRGGRIPVGGLVSPFARGNVILLGDSAGIVSPLTAGGIHTAMHYGKVLGNSIAYYLHKNGDNPEKIMAKIYPKFYLKQSMRFAYENFAPNFLLNIILTNPVFRKLASDVFFKRKKLR
ncbi:MAG: NAD(P)/FAD-dependent oxidoreductase [Rickettsiales bacterium]